MNLRALIRTIAVVAIAIVAPTAWANVTCTPTVTPNSLAFSSYDNVNGTIASVSVTYDCNRGAGSDVVTAFNFYPTAGSNVSGATRRMVATGPIYVNYDILKTNAAPFNTYWGNGSPTGSTPVTGTINNGNFNSGHSLQTFTVYVRIPPGQAPTAGLTYQDLGVQFTGSCTSKASSSGGAAATVCTVGTANFSPISLLISGATCSIGTVPDMALQYTSYQTVASQAVSNFTANCTNGLPYWFSLNAAAASQAVAVTTVNSTASNNINYSLDVPTGTKTGTGAQQNWSVTGTVAANQSGTCATTTCTSTAQQHTVYVNY